MMWSNIQKPGGENACDNHCNDTGFPLTESYTDHGGSLE